MFSTPSWFHRRLIKTLQTVISAFIRSNTIKSGPFAGITIQRNTFGSSYLPKIYGTYEHEIADLFKNSIQSSITTFVDVGCAGGYYCELARALNFDLDIIGYDINEKALQYCREILPCSEFVNDHFNYEEYASLDEDILFLIDIEGGEFSLFCKDTNLNIKHTFLIELHLFGKNENSEIIFANMADFDTVFISYDVSPDLTTLNSWSKCFEYLFRHELRHDKTQYLLIKKAN